VASEASGEPMDVIVGSTVAVSMVTVIVSLSHAIAAIPRTARSVISKILEFLINIETCPSLVFSFLAIRCCTRLTHMTLTTHNTSMISLKLTSKVSVYRNITANTVTNPSDSIKVLVM